MLLYIKVPVDRLDSGKGMTKSRFENSQGPLYKDRNLQIIFCVTLMVVMSISSITPAFPKIVRELGISSRSVGLLITVFTFPGIFLTPVLGVLADRYGRRRILVPSLLLFAIAGGACSLVRDFEALITLRFLQGVGASSLGAINVTIIGDLYSGNQRTAAMGYNASVLSVGTAVYPAIGGALATFEWYYPFALPIIAAPVALLVIFRLRNPEPVSDQHFREYLLSAWESIIDKRVIGLFIASIGTFVILFGAYLTCFPLLMGEEFQASPFVIGIFMSTMSLSTALTSSQLGRLARSFSERGLLRLSYLLYAAALIAIPLAPHIWILLIPILLSGIAAAMNMPTIQTLLAGLAPMRHRAAFMSINGMVLRIGQTLGPLIVGVILSVWGLAGAFYTSAVMAFLMILLVIILI